MLKSATALDKSRFYIWFWQKNSGQTGQPALAPQQKKTIIMDENVVTAKSLYAMVASTCLCLCTWNFFVEIELVLEIPLMMWGNFIQIKVMT